MLRQNSDSAAVQVLVDFKMPENADMNRAAQVGTSEIAQCLFPQSP